MSRPPRRERSQPHTFRTWLGEATRLVSCSQEGSGAFVARLPDTSLTGSIIASSAFLVILRLRRLGLFLTALTSCLDAAAAAGHPVTEYHRLGDLDINDANNTMQHRPPQLRPLCHLSYMYHAIKAVIPPASPPAPVYSAIAVTAPPRRRRPRDSARPT